MSTTTHTTSSRARFGATALCAVLAATGLAACNDTDGMKEDAKMTPTEQMSSEMMKPEKDSMEKDSMMSSESMSPEKDAMKEDSMMSSESMMSTEEKKQ
ncbi:hypothetical protein [Corynebacterium riegelii]|uniref:hypothetical protein n=1 Tax=Corynebacterium riegelii TaxID=156976 RepID=UPI00288BD910|nr:hypothetical protein [Corynebacterium riegelii]